MEVHTHTHTPRKKFAHYLWEFLMLFLAVFCGFLAENKREHMVENHRAKELVVALLNDLQHDTAQLNMLIAKREEKQLLLDSLNMLLQRPVESIDRNTFYTLIARSSCPGARPRGTTESQRVVREPETPAPRARLRRAG